MLRKIIKNREFDNFPPDRLKFWKWTYRPTDRIESLNPKDVLCPRETIGEFSRAVLLERDVHTLSDL